MDVSRETELLAQYAALLRKWSPKINMISPSTIDKLEDRHLEDCLQLARLAVPKSGVWVDLGSGGGLPAIVLAITAADTPARFLLVESDQRKSAFLRAVARQLDLDVTVKTGRIEEIAPLCADAITVRALAPLPRLMPYLYRHLDTKGQAWVMKGESWKAELEQVSDWSFQLTVHESKTRSGAVILQMANIHR